MHELRTMQAQRRSSDPLVGYSGLTLFPRTLASVPNAPKPYGNDDIPYAHNFLKAMPLQSPDKLLEQAKAIVDRSSGLSMSEIPSYATSKNINEVVATKVTENPQERRPALGRKRARFSLKPKSSQPTVSLEHNLDIDKLKDPEEFFLAFEKIENAKRELQKQTGGILMDLNQQNLSTVSRPRRPGILGRSVKYKHHYLNDMSSQETFEGNVCSLSDYNVQKETTKPDVDSQEREPDGAEIQEKELVGLVAKSGKMVNELLDELLAGGDEEFDEDGAVTLLQEHLQIKPIDLEKLCLPDLQDVRRINLQASGAYLPNPTNALSNITNLLKGMSSKTPKKHKLAESPITRFASPTPPKNPLDSIISLKKRILQSNSSIDPFSAHNIDQSQVGNASPVGCIENKMDVINMEKEVSISSKLKSIMIEENGIADVNTSLPQLTIGDVTCSSEKTVNDNLSRLGSGVNVSSSGFHSDVEGSIRGSCVDNRVVSGTSGRLDTDADVQTNKLIEFNDKAKIQMEDVLQDAIDSVQPGLNMENSTAKKLNGHQSELGVCMSLPGPFVGDVTHSSDKTVNDNLSRLDSGVRSNGFHADVIEDVLQEAIDSVQPDLKLENLNVEKLNRTQDQTSCDVVENHAVDGLSKTTDSVPEQHSEKIQISTKEPFNEQSKVRLLPRKRGKHEVASSRKSLADQTSCDVVEGHAMDGPSKTADTGLEQHDEEVQTSTRKPINEQSKAISRPRENGIRERASRRQSLAAAGTSWKLGVRRSTRIRSRPLEYWKGERFLYGRVHQSLTTVIGIKYESPGSNDGKPTVKVKSFVSGEYKDLVDLAAGFSNRNRD